ncbi:hypothetical protein D4765_10165 [Subtercola vilae]|uniref:Uncharacterized protein n=1 Tax=Subtercola vilae TaxID=2056433 RepID=A0A4T2BZJ6_9MICO|nr:hypothetical protein D4765_10165 [Subtercola vilae]
MADGFRLSEPELGNDAFSEWRISVLRGEAYAVLRRLPGARNFAFSGPVWVLGDVPTEGPNGQEPSKDARELLAKVEAVRNEPDLLLRAIEVLQTPRAIAC